MFEPIWQAVKAELSGEKARDFTARIWEHARWNSFDHMQETAAEIAAIMREIGLEEVEVLEYPADGVTAYGGWVMPEAWDVEGATLEIVEPRVPEPLLADYKACPQSLMMYSLPTPPEGVVAEVVLADEGEGSYDGKVVLIHGIGLDHGLRAFARGAAGLVADAAKLPGSPQEKSPCSARQVVQWHNYTIPPWKTERKGFGFSISPADGERLRGLLREHGTVRLRATVRTRLYEGKIPLVTGLLRGETSEEIALTGHLCEPGANDNSSGCALGLEVARTVKALRDQGKLPGLQRGIRPAFSFEVRGYQAFLATWPRLNRLFAGLNLDMVGNDLSEARARSNLLFNFATSPAYTDVLALELLVRLQHDDPLFRFRTASGELVDNLFGEPAVGAPMAVLGNWPDAYYHNSLDRIETISPRAMGLFGRMAATYCAFLANAGFPEALSLAQAVEAFAQHEILECARHLVETGRDPVTDLDRIARQNATRLRSLARLVRPRSLVASEEGLRQNKDWLCPWSHLFRDVELGQRLERVGERLAAFARRVARDVRSDRRYAKRAGALPKVACVPRPDHTLAEEQRARRLVPVRTFKGALCFESLDEAALAELEERTGIDIGWGAPSWLQLALFRSNGKRTAWDIWHWLKAEAAPPRLETFCETVDFLGRHGFVRLRPVLRKEDYLAALAAVGLPAGAVVLVHSSLSGFGYVEGGAETVIEALLEAVGPQGTLAMPTLSCSWVGRPPFDRAKTPSRVGAITEAFRRRPGVLRSAHPTHSVAALGPAAEEIVRDHVPERPVFSPEGAFGRLYELDAWILMLCKLAANTSMHMAEERAGLLRTSLVGHVIADGKRREVPIVNAPGHVNFDGHYKLLSEREQLRAAPLGEGTIHLMRMRQAVDAALENVRKDPLLATGGERCTCEFCRNIRGRSVEGRRTRDEGKKE